MNRLFTLVIMILILSISASAFSQDVKQSLIEQRKQKLEQERDQRQAILQRTPYDRLRAVLEGPVDPETYILGPGDQMILGVFGSVFEESVPIDVLPEGVVYVPGIGPVSVKNMSLLEAQTIIEEKLGKLYRDSKVSLTLAVVRTFKVYVTGEVQFPGEYIANATTRVSSLLDQAYGMTDWADGRAVEIIHADGTKNMFDYYAYLYEGEQGSNISVKDGDVVFLPNRNNGEGTVMLRSGENVVGIYPLEGETDIRQFLQDSGLIYALFDWENISILRNTPNGRPTTINYQVSNVRSVTTGTKVLIRPGDTIIASMLTPYVYVQGEVRNPGEVVWEPNRRASYYIGSAGKTSQAYQELKMKVIRGEEELVIQDKDPIIYPGDIISIPRRWYLTMREYLEFMMPITSILISAKALGVIK